jgi:hypothetical protein
VLTLTTDPARFDSLAAATETLMDDVNRLKAWVANRFADGSRPPSVVVPEFTEKGFPHVHVALFGEGFVPHAVLSNYWGGRRDHSFVMDRVLRGAVRDLVEEGEHYKSVNIAEKCYDWLADVDEVTRAPERREYINSTMIHLTVSSHRQDAQPLLRSRRSFPP